MTMTTSQIETILRTVMLEGETIYVTRLGLDSSGGPRVFYIKCANQTAAMERCWGAANALTARGVPVISTSHSLRGGWHAIIEVP